MTATSSPTFVTVARYLLKGSALLGFTVAAPVAIRATAPVETPIISTFAPNQLDGETYIWEILQTQEGQIVASGERLLAYANNRWAVIPHPRKQAIRSLLVVGDTLWIASASEIGRLTLPLNAESKYSTIATDSLRNAGEIWSFHGKRSRPRGSRHWQTSTIFQRATTRSCFAAVTPFSNSTSPN